MLAATWVLAAATTVLALSVPVAWFTWLGSRRQDREEAFRKSIMDDVSKKFTPKDAIIGGGVVLGLLGLLLFAERKPDGD